MYLQSMDKNKASGCDQFCVVSSYGGRCEDPHSLHIRSLGVLHNRQARIEDVVGRLGHTGR